MIMSALGQTLRKLRKQKRWTLQELASRSGLSVSFLSQAERELCSISIVSLEKICDALGTSLLEVLADEQKKVPKSAATSPLIHKGQGVQVQLGSNPMTYEHLTVKLPQQRFEVIAHNIPANYRSDVLAHEGEEFGYVLSGTLILQTKDRDYDLSVGDSYHILAEEPHGYAAGDDPTRVLVVSTQQFIEWYETALVNGIGALNNSPCDKGIPDPKETPGAGPAPSIEHR